MQNGYLFEKSGRWYLRYNDTVRVSDTCVKRKQLSKKLPDDCETAKQRKDWARDFLAPLNAGLVRPESTMLVEDFIENVYFAQCGDQLRTNTLKSYRQIFDHYLKGRIGRLNLREYRTVHGQKLLADVSKSGLSKNTMKHIQAFFSTCFKKAKGLGYLDGVNPIQDTWIPRTPEREDTYAYSGQEVETMLAALTEPSRTVVLCASLSGLRKSELRGLQWRDFDGKQLSVRRSVCGSETNPTKNAASKAAVPCVKVLADALHALRVKLGVLATPDSPIFQAERNAKPLNLDNLARRVIIPALKGLPTQWRGWHAFRRGLATRLHSNGVDDRTIQAILRHSDIATTQGIYVKSLDSSRINAMETLILDVSCKNHATESSGLLN